MTTPTSPSGNEPDAESSATLDRAVDRAVAALRHLPDVPPDAVERVVATAVARNGIPGRRRAAATTWLARAAGLLLAAGLGAAGATWGLGRTRAADEAPVRQIAQTPDPAPVAGGIGRPVAEAVLDEERPIDTP